MKSAALHQAIHDRLTDVMLDDGYALWGGLWDDDGVWDDTQTWNDAFVPKSVTGVYYNVPQAADSNSASAFPYITVGPYQFNQFDTKTDIGQSALVDVHLWSRETSPLIWMQMQEAIYNSLHDWDLLTVAGVNIINCLYEDSVEINDPDGKTVHTVTSFRVTYLES